MHRWVIIIACGLANLPLAADETSGGSAESVVPALHSAGAIRNDGSIQDSIGTVSVRPVPDAAEEVPLCFQRVDYLRKHNDDILAIAYLRQVVTNGDILPQFRARAILELADCLDSQHRDGESLCWLKIWMELYPARPEIGAVAYRIGSLYTQMGLPDLARDAFYLALAHTINEGQVQNADDLQRYSRLTIGTLWGLAANEYQAARWARAAELFDRYRREAQSASTLSLEKAAFLQADCDYQLKKSDLATSLYEETLQKHPFNPLAPQARLRLYHLYILQNAPQKAQEELQSLAWTVRTVWPRDETYWQKQTAQVLLALNQKNMDILPPLVEGSSQLPPEGKTWQDALNHYDTLVSYQAVTTHAIMDSPVTSSWKGEAHHGPLEEDDLQVMNRNLDQLLPPPQTASNQ